MLCKRDVDGINFLMHAASGSSISTAATSRGELVYRPVEGKYIPGTSAPRPYCQHVACWDWAAKVRRAVCARVQSTGQPHGSSTVTSVPSRVVGESTG